MNSHRLFLGVDGKLALTDAGKCITAMLHVRVEPVWKSAPAHGLNTDAASSQNVTAKAHLAGVGIVIVGAEGLRDADFDGSSDPFCICSIPGKEDMQFKTGGHPRGIGGQYNYPI